MLGSQFRFIDGALLTPAYTWSGLMAALLAGGEPVGAIARSLGYESESAFSTAFKRVIGSRSRGHVRLAAVV